MKIVVAMSGGVDSSVVAHKLHEEGHELVGIMMKLWIDPLAPETRDYLPKKCCSIEHIQRARSVCTNLGIPFYVVNFEDEFKQNVIDSYLQDHTNALTPNPCITCNKTIKFGALLNKVEELGYDALATGHYANIKNYNSDLALYKSKNNNKDQSYYLYTLTQNKLQKILFPLGDLDKSEVYELAKAYNVPIPEYYKESEDLCFYPENSPEPFLQRYIPSIKPGDILNESGQVIGTHKGLPFYTIGQRRGLNIGGLKIPLHVASKNAEMNTLTVKEAGKDMEASFHFTSIHWINEAPSAEELTVRTSSLGMFQPCSVSLQENIGVCTLQNAARGLAPGQSAVFYDGERVVGGGIICNQP